METTIMQLQPVRDNQLTPIIELKDNSKDWKFENPRIIKKKKRGKQAEC